MVSMNFHHHHPQKKLVIHTHTHTHTHTFRKFRNESENILTSIIILDLEARNHLWEKNFSQITRIIRLGVLNSLLVNSFAGWMWVG